MSAVTLLPEPDSPTMPRSARGRARSSTPSTARHDAVHDLEVGPQVADVEQDVVGRAAPRRPAARTVDRLGHARDLGSNASRRPSPMKFTASTVTMIARPGKNGHHQLPWGMNVQAAGEDVAPGRRRSGRRRTRGSSRTPRAMMLPATISDATTTIGLNALGRMWRKMIRRSRTPTAARRLDELALADRQEQAPHEAAHAHPAEQPEDDDDQRRRCRCRGTRLATRITNSSRQAEHDVDDAHQDVVDEAADEARRSRPRSCR